MRSLTLTILLGALALPAAAIAAEPSTVTLSAVGETHLAPDMATLSLGVTVTAPTAAEAMQTDAARMTQVIAALRRQGVAERDIQTAGLNVQPQYSFPQNQPRQLTGYQASHQLTIAVRDLERLGAAIDAGANDIGGIGFGLKDPGAAEDAARLKAVAALRAKADLYARAAGYSVGRLINLSEGGGYAPGPVRPLPMMAMAKVASTPVEAGELDVRVEASAVYELK